jgi:hypothetical protein
MGYKAGNAAKDLYMVVGPMMRYASIVWLSCRLSPGKHYSFGSYVELNFSTNLGKEGSTTISIQIA